MKKKASLDFYRLLASFFVVAIHTSPFYSINPAFDFFFSRILSRVAVPLFLMITGYFAIPKALKDKDYLKKYLIKTLKLYLLCIIIYIPLNIYKNDFQRFDIIELLKALFIDGTIYHLWYFPALLLGLPLTYYLIKKNNSKINLVIFFLLYLIGLLGDSYFGIVEKSACLQSIYNFIFSISSYTRNGLFYVPIFLFLGYIAKIRNTPFSKNNIYFFLISLLLLVIEGFSLNNLNFIRHDSMYIMLIPVMFFLFECIKNSSNISNIKIRNIATSIYIFHPYFIVIERLIAKLFCLENIMIENSIIHYILVIILTLIFSISIEKIKVVIKNGRFCRKFS